GQSKGLSPRLGAPAPLDNPRMWHKTTIPPRRESRFHRLARMALRENRVEHPLDALAISKVPQSFSHHKTFVTSSRLGQRVQQPVTLLIEDDLDFLRHRWPRMHDLSWSYH